jgi:hypothetical protein
MEGEGRLEEIVRSTDWLMRALIAAREVAAPDWMPLRGQPQAPLVSACPQTGIP